ncbi:MAG: FtsX-like permease family protein [Saprospiraceae bacterium]
MLRNYYKIAIRNVVKNKLHAFINVFGLAIGFVVAILCLLYIKNELAYDKWIPNQAQIYRVYRQAQDQDAGGWVYTPIPLASTLANEVVGVKRATNLYLEKEVLFSKGETAVYLKDIAFVDTSFFDVFAFSFKAGNPNTVLDQKKSIVISESVAHLFFGDSNPIGETIKLNGETEYSITGVMEVLPGSTSLEHEVYLPIEGNVYAGWLANRVTTYIQIEEKADIHQIAQETDKLLFPIYKKERQAFNLPVETINETPRWKFQPLAEIHLYSTNISDFRNAGGNLHQLYIFGLIAFIILLIASINYMNLATARATVRAKEVGMRKVSGAKKSQLIGQFLTESLLLSLVALIVAMVFAEFLLPLFEQIINRDLTFFAEGMGTIALPLLGLSVLIGLLAGVYPAFFLSRFEPVKVLKGHLLKTAEGQFFRKALVVTQFATSIVLIVIMLFIYKQVHFMQSQELGFNDDQVMTITINNPDSWRKFLGMRHTFEEIEGVQSISLANSLPGQKNSIYAVKVDGLEQIPQSEVLFITEDFDQTLDLDLMAGRFFSSDLATDTISAFVVNEKFIHNNNISNPIGKGVKLLRDDHFGQIIGVVKDFHFNGLQEEIQPLVMTGRRNLEYYNYVAFKLKAKDLPTTIAAVNQKWAEIEPHHPVRFTFLDEKFAAQYEENKNFGRIMVYATCLTIFIAILGLFGLSSFLTIQRSKEIGVRKVLGATVSNLVNLLVKDFVRLILIAGLIATPIGYWLVGIWLQDFAYATVIDAFPFVLAVILAILLAILTVSFQSIKVSTQNPVAALKSE